MTDTKRAATPPAATPQAADITQTELNAIAKSAPQPRQQHRGVAHFFQAYALVIITAAAFAFFSFAPASSAAFPTANNLAVVLGSNAVVSLIALAALFPLVCGFMDFSIGATTMTSQVACAGIMVNYGLPLWLGIIVALAISVVIGTVNGFFVTRLKMDPLVTTLGMSILLSGLLIWYTGGQTLISGIDQSLIHFGSARWFGIPAVFVVVLIAALFVWYFFRHIPFGRSLYAIGSNAASARLVGVRVDRNIWWSFIASSTISGFAGVLQLSRIGSATASDGGSLMFAALASVFLGATAITPGFFNVWGTIISAIFVSLSVSGLTISGASGWATNVFNGAALLIAVALSTYLGRRNRRS
ncbi:MAG: ABC transporter permease [Microbacteriaceae bacterium]